MTRLDQGTRARGLARPTAGLVLGLLAAVMVMSLTALAAPAATDHRIDLLVALVDGVRFQGGFYQVAADALRAAGDPQRASLAVPFPALPTVLALLPSIVSAALLWGLAAAVLVAWRPRLPRVCGRAGAIVPSLLLAAGCVGVARPEHLPVPELWAGLLIALSLAARRPDEWTAAIAFALAASLIAPAAALYPSLMIAFALAERRRAEALGWGAALGLFALAWAVHAHAVGLVVRPSAAAGWHAPPGLDFGVRALVEATALSLLPIPLAAPLVVLSLAGWAAWRDPLAMRVLATIGGYLLLSALATGPEGASAALLVAPVAPVGLALVPDLLRDLAEPLLDKRRITVRRVVR